MKKIISVILALALLLAACAALAEDTAANAYDAYDQSGYTHNSVGISGDDSGDVLQICFTSADRTDCVLVEAALTDEEVAAFEALDFFDENYDANQWKLVTSLPADRITVTSLNDRIPSEEVMGSYLGNTVADLMNDGYEWSTNAYDENGDTVMVFYNWETGVMYAVTLEGDPDPEQLSDELIGSQVIESIRFWGFEAC